MIDNVCMQMLQLFGGLIEHIVMNSGHAVTVHNGSELNFQLTWVSYTKSNMFIRKFISISIQWKMSKSWNITPKQGCSLYCDYKAFIALYFLPSCQVLNLLYEISKLNIVYTDTVETDNILNLKKCMIFASYGFLNSGFFCLFWYTVLDLPQLNVKEMKLHP